jgi:hypothetical protein
MCALICEVEDGPEKDAEIVAVFTEVWKCFVQDAMLEQFREPATNMDNIRAFLKAMSQIMDAHPLPIASNSIRHCGMMLRHLWLGLGGYAFMQPYEV